MTRERLKLLLAALAGAAAVAVAWWLLRARSPQVTRPLPEPLEVVELVASALAPIRQGGVTQVPFRPGSSEELESYRHWVNTQLHFAVHAAPPHLPAPQGFRSAPLAGWGQLLAEELPDRRGAGALVLRTGAARPVLIEVPHSFYDEGTLDIGLQVFARSGARALLVNTVHRFRIPLIPVEAGGPYAGSSPSDLAHAETSFFLTAHSACVDLVPALDVVQLHGFADAAAPGADVIVSAAGTRADPVAPARALERALGIRAAAYPTQIRVLGGTKNRQAHYSIAAGGSFLHVEMNRTLRDRLLADPNAISQLVDALLGGSP